MWRMLTWASFAPLPPSSSLDPGSAQTPQIPSTPPKHLGPPRTSASLSASASEPPGERGLFLPTTRAASATGRAVEAPRRLRWAVKSMPIPPPLPSTCWE
ncbi:hypothetical protein B0H16DRAFT_1500910 [Mycena metata]|uniref:Uncharacterized protein n=1 Tax=Mycena metata TaxID=1033252 RepID=A0AAD7NXB4_9AGAR|nr:hypothetical protein B0H16DRAFT_1500910 [Mycena metata]